jgi:alanine-glyoxylate transaminase/serine-glyoxylate transaminase/serine-pyruvate transaminase
VVTTHSPVVLDTVPMEARVFLERSADNVVRREPYRDIIQRALYGRSQNSLSILCEDPEEYSNSLTAVVVPGGVNADAVLRASERLNLSLGTGLGRLRGRAFRIGHLGALGDLEVIATLGGVEMALRMAGVPVTLGAGVAACQEFLMAHHMAAPPTAPRS